MDNVVLNPDSVSVDIGNHNPDISVKFKDCVFYRLDDLCFLTGKHCCRWCVEDDLFDIRYGMSV